MQDRELLYRPLRAMAQLRQHRVSVVQLQYRVWIQHSTVTRSRQGSCSLKLCGTAWEREVKHSTVPHFALWWLIFPLFLFSFPTSHSKLYLPLSYIHLESYNCLDWKGP